MPSYFLKRKTFLDRASYYLLRVKDKDLADELFLRINEKEASFNNLAIEYSEGPESKMGGFLPLSPIANIHPELARVIQISKSGDIWPPIKIEKWWIILKLEELQTAKYEDKLISSLALELGENFLNFELKKNENLHQ